MEKYQNVRYESIEEKAMKKSTRYSAVVLGILCLVYGILVKMFYAWAIGLLLIIALLFQRKFSITDRGLEMDYRLLVPLHHEVWTFEEIESIHREKPKTPGLTALNFMKGLSGKRLVFSVEIAEEIVQMALEKNKSIDYHDGN